MLSRLRQLNIFSKPTTRDFNKVVERLNLLSNIHGGGGIGVRTNPAGINIFNTSALTQALSLGIYEVGTSATGNGIYNCFPVLIDATNWALVTKVDKFSSLPAWNNATAYETGDTIIEANVSYICILAHTNQQPPNATYWKVADVEILNTDESYPVADADFTEALALFDLIQAFKVSDDEGTTRFIGTPLGTKVRTAKTKEAAQNDDSIQCNLILRNGNKAASGELGFDIEVFGHANSGTADFDDALPRLADDVTIAVYNQQGKWWYATTVQQSKICTCAEP